MDIDALIRQHQSEVFSLCRSMVRDPDVAEDLAQDSLAKAFAARDGFRGEASARTWLMAIARNRCRDHLRRQHGSPFVDDPDVAEEGPVDDAPLPATMLSDQGQVRIALESLPEAWRAMVVLRFVHGFSYDELSATFGIGNGAARMRVSRSLKQMREALQAPEVPVRVLYHEVVLSTPDPAPPPEPEAAVPDAQPIDDCLFLADPWPSPPNFGAVLAAIL